MNIIKIITGLLFVSFFSCAVYADIGQCNYGSEVVPAVICFGNASLNGTQVTGSVNIAGALAAVNAVLGSMNVVGGAHLTNCKISHTAFLAGGLEVQQTIFNAPLTVATSKLHLNSSSVNGPLTINATMGSPLVILNSSHINGDVIFQGRFGLIEEQGGSEITGKVINGRIRARGMAQF